jgi:hypothetical protein
MHPSIIFVNKDGAYPSGALTGLHLLTNVPLVWRYLAVINTIAYKIVVLITILKVL